MPKPSGVVENMPRGIQRRAIEAMIEELKLEGIEEFCANDLFITANRIQGHLAHLAQNGHLKPVRRDGNKQVYSLVR